jgi:hypothetical protein
MIKVKINPKVQEIARSQYSMDNAAGEMHEPQRSAMAGMEENCGCGTCETCGPSKKIIVRILNNEAADKLHGGTADNVPKSKFNKKELSMGVDDEKEHTDDEDVASEIARDHLANDPNYYTHAKEAGLDEKKDRCYKLAKQKYDVFPSAYASGFIVRCRKGKVAKKKTNEELDEGTFDKEKSKGLHGWFQRQGGKGKSKGWVDCNTCRTDAKTGRKTCKTCGRQDGEERSKYPACRPTPSACNKSGTSKKKGSDPVSWKDKKDEN